LTQRAVWNWETFHSFVVRFIPARANIRHLGFDVLLAIEANHLGVLLDYLSHALTYRVLVVVLTLLTGHNVSEKITYGFRNSLLQTVHM
jgi:hypothetical protein